MWITTWPQGAIVNTNTGSVRRINLNLRRIR